MPIIQEESTQPSKIENNIPKIFSPELQSTVVDTKQQPLMSLLQYVEGAPWKLNFYSQILARDSEPRGQDVNQSAIYQSYKKINDMEVRVTDALTWSQAEQTAMGTVVGTALINGYVIPNVGDMFCADVGDGREGVFQITSSERRSHLKGAVYLVNYMLMYFSSDAVVRRKDLEAKVTQVFFWHRDFLLRGQNPIVQKDTHHAVEALGMAYYEMIQNYFGWFYSREFNTLLVPGQEGIRVYDHFVTTMLLGMLESRDDPAIPFIKRLNVDDSNDLRKPQLFAAILRRDKSLLRLSNRSMGLASTRSFAYNPSAAGIRYVGVHYVVYPNSIQASADDWLNKLDWGKYTGFATMADGGSTTPGGNLNQILYADELEYAALTRRMLKPVNMERGYVLSDDFYDNTPMQSVLELMVRQYLNQEPIDERVLQTLVSTYTNWGSLERFYYIPLCLALIKSTIHNY